MLCELRIENLALFESASLSFGPGLGVVTGETGAGKSLLIGALELLLDTAEQTRLLDAFGGSQPLLERYRGARARWIELADRVAGFERAARDHQDRIDLLRFQARELADAKISVEEHADLRAQRERL